MNSQNSTTAVAAGPEQQRWTRYLDPLFELRRGTVVTVVLAMVVVIAVADKYIERNISLGVLYIFPIVLAALALRRWEMLALVSVCAVLREHYSPFSWEPDVQYRLFYTWISYGGLGLVLGEIARNRRLMICHYIELREQIERRRTAEAQLIALVESSPAGVIAVDPEGRIEVANSAAEQIFGLERHALLGQRVERFLPVIGEVTSHGNASDVVYRATTTCLGRRANGESFHAYVWFSTLATPAGNRLAAIIVDSTDDLRDLQEASLQSILSSTRVLVGSVSHEIRNLSAAIVMVHANLGRIPGVSQTEDYRALGTLAQGLTRLATVELSQTQEQTLSPVSLQRVIEEFCIIVKPSLEAIDGALVREIADDLPLALGDHQGLIQVLMNLSRNSVRAMQETPVRRLTLRATVEGDSILLRVIDTGPGLSNRDLAFQPFQPGANATGLGLFVSRAIIRACHGELYAEPSAAGCVMVVKLKIYPGDDAGPEAGDNEGNP